MPELENARRELFAVLVARGKGTESECYAQAGFKAKNDRVARSCASRLLATANISDRVQELKTQFAQAVTAGLAVTTTDVARHLWQLSNYDVTDVLKLETTGRGKARRQRLIVKDTKDWPEAMRRTCQGLKVAPDGSVQVLLPDRRTPATKVGEHLGMFQGEQANTLVDNSQHRTMVYVDAPRHETAEEWERRVAKQRGMKLIEGKLE